MALIVIAAILLGIVVRVAFLQTTEADTLRSAGIDQWTRSVALPAQRGTVFDRYGNELAMSVPAATISINPKLVENGPATVQLLDDLLGLDDDKTTELLAEIAAKDRGFVFVQRQADAAIGDQLSAMRLAGVNVDRESRREMPGGDTGRSIIGSTNIDGVGISGLELQYDGILTGTGGSLRREVAPGGRSIPGSETVTERPVSGQDLVLTLDRSIQFSTEQVLLEKVSEIGARGATAIVVDTDSGEIYSMASVRQDDTTGAYEVTSGNFAAVDAYEPGSVAKVITIASALSEGLVTPEKTYVVPWRKQYYDDLLKDSHEHPDETLTVSQILTESSNIGTIFVQQEMGRWKHRDYMAAFGLGEKTALGLPRRVHRDPEGSGRPVGLRTCHGRVRAGCVEHVAATRRCGQHHRQRRCLRRPQAREIHGRPRRHDHRHAAVDHAARRQRAGCAADDGDDAQRGVFRYRDQGQGRRALDRGQDRYGVQGGGQRHVLRRQRRPHLLRELRGLLPGRRPAGHRARVGRRAAIGDR